MRQRQAALCGQPASARGRCYDILPSVGVVVYASPKPQPDYNRNSGYLIHTLQG